MGEMMPCPFCGESEEGWLITEVAGSFKHGWVVKCVYCDAEGPFTNSNEQESINKWNQRPNNWITDRLPTKEEQYNQPGAWGVMIKLKSGARLSGHYEYDGGYWETGGEGFPIKDEVYGWMLWPV